MKAITLILAISFPFLSFSQNSYYGNREKGWFWYEIKEMRKDSKKEEIKDLEPSKGLSAKEILKKQGEDWESSVAIAVLEPNEKNLEDYIIKTEKITSQATVFSKAFEKFLWRNPRYDLLLENPTNTQAILAKNRDKEREIDQQIDEIAKNYGILFFFASSCSVCHAFAPILKNFSKKYNFTILPISQDGIGLKEFPYFKTDTYFSQSLNVKVTPSIYLLHPDSNKISSINFGYADFEKLRQKIIVAYERIQNDN